MPAKNVGRLWEAYRCLPREALSKGRLGRHPNLSTATARIGPGRFPRHGRGQDPALRRYPSRPPAESAPRWALPT